MINNHNCNVGSGNQCRVYFCLRCACYWASRCAKRTKSLPRRTFSWSQSAPKCFCRPTVRPGPLRSLQLLPQIPSRIWGKKDKPTGRGRRTDRDKGWKWEEKDGKEAKGKREKERKRRAEKGAPDQCPWFWRRHCSVYVTFIDARVFVRFQLKTTTISATLR